MKLFLNALLLVIAGMSFTNYAQAQGFGPARPDNDRPSWDRRPDRRPTRPVWDRRDERCWEEAERIASSIVNLSNTVYWKLDREVYRMDHQLRRSLSELSQSAGDFRSTASRYRNIDRSVSDLYELERRLDDVDSDLRFVREARVVSREMRELRDNVRELLYIFRQD
jgi:hypothetical protein